MCPKLQKIAHVQITWHAFLEKHANIYATYKVASIHGIARMTVYWQHRMMMTMQNDSKSIYIYLVGQLPKSVKNHAKLHISGPS